MTHLVLALVLYASGFLVAVHGSRSCTSAVKSLGRATDAHSCALLCKTYTSKKTGPCFGYVYNRETDSCRAYVFIYSPKHATHHICAANYGASVAAQPEDAELADFVAADLEGYYSQYYVDEEGEGEDSVKPLGEENGADDPPRVELVDSGDEAIVEGQCVLKRRKLGPVKSSVECKKACKELESDVYGGCVAWLYDANRRLCSGVVSKETRDRKTCGSIEDDRKEHS